VGEIKVTNWHGKNHFTQNVLTIAAKNACMDAYMDTDTFVAHIGHIVA